MFNFNQFSSLLLVGAIPALLHALLLFVRAWREERWSDFLAGSILVVGLLYVTQWMLGFGGWYDERDGRTTVMFYVLWDQLIVLGPLCWLYFRAVTNTDFRWQRRYWLHFVPWLLYLLPYIIVLLYDWIGVRLINGEVFTFFGDTRGPAMEWMHSSGGYPGEVVFALIRLGLIAYLLLTVRDYRRYRKYLKEEFSNADQLSFSGHGYLLGLLLLGICLTVIIEGVNLFSTDAGYTDAWFSYMTMAVLLLFAGVEFYAVDTRLTRSLRFGGAAAGAMTGTNEQGQVSQAATSTPSLTSGPPNTTAEDTVWAEKLNNYLAEHPAHLNPELKLGDLAKALGTNPSVLSRVINTNYQLNFNDFINARRCAAFLEKVEAGEHRRHTLLSLALDSGFNSKSTFNRAFRKHYGKSPKAAVEESVSNHNSGRPKY
jgi:AraC-like DNA-binding protein